MPDATGTPDRQTARRVEKLRVLSALLGPEAVERLRHDLQPPPPVPDIDPDADRAAWHRNRLLERLRSRSPREPGEGRRTPDGAEVSRPATQQPTPSGSGVGPGVRSGVGSRLATAGPAARGGHSMDARLASNLEPGGLAGEHPAVIARLLLGLGRPARIEALKSLPGPVARTVVRRLRDL